MGYRILGPLEVVAGEEAVPIGPKPRTLLAVLLLHSNEAVSAQRLADELWGERQPATAQKLVQLYVSQLRKVLGDAIVTRPPGYLIRVETDELDAARFQRLLAEARADADQAPAEAADLYGAALDLWRGRALADVAFESFAANEADALDAMHQTALEERVDVELALGRTRELVPELESLVAVQPLRERPRAQLMLALYRSGRRADALAVYRETRRLLVEELGIEPGDELRSLERAILEDDPSVRISNGRGRTDGAAASVAPARAARAAPRRRQRIRWWTIVVAVGAALAAGVIAAALDDGASAPTAVTGHGALLFVDPGSGHVSRRVELAHRPTAEASVGQRLWLVGEDGTLTRVSAGSAATGSIRVGGTLGGVVAGDGSVWVVDEDTDRVVRIDARTLDVVDRVRTGNGVGAIAFGAGAVWVTNEADGKIARIDTSDDSVRTFWMGPSPGLLAFGAGSVWVTDSQAGAVTRVDARTNAPVAWFQVAAMPTSIVFGDGSLWVASAQSGTVSRIDPRTNHVLSSPTAPGGDARAYAFGTVWVGGASSDGLARLDADGHHERPFRVGGAPVGVASLGSTLAVAAVPVGRSHRGGKLVIAGRPKGVGSEPTLDPTTWWHVDGWMILGATNDGLVTVRRTAGVSGSRIVPDLARSLPLADPAGTSYTFVLRRGIRFSTGRPVRASDVRASIQRLWRMKPTIAGRAEPTFLIQEPSLRLGLVGEDRCAARPRRCNLAQAIVTDDRTGSVTFHLARKNGAFVRLLTLPFYDLLPAGTPARDHRVLPATGPYRIARYVPHRRLVLLRNPRFHAVDGRPDGYAARIVWRLDTPQARAQREVVQGRADLLAWQKPLPPRTIAELELHHASQLHVTQTSWLKYLFLNTRVPPFDRIDARRALAEAIDRRPVASASRGALGARFTCQLVPPGYAGYRPYCPYTIAPNEAGTWLGPDFARAKRDVRRSHTAGMQVTVWVDDTRNDPPYVPVARHVARVLRALGYRTSVKVVAGETNKKYYTRVASPKTGAQIGIATWIPAFASNTAIFPLLLGCRSPKNYSRFCDRGLDGLMRRAAELEATDPARASRLWSLVDHRVVDEAPLIPLFDVPTTDVVSRRLGNYIFNTELGALIDQAWVR